MEAATASVEGAEEAGVCLVKVWLVEGGCGQVASTVVNVSSSSAALVGKLIPPKSVRWVQSQCRNPSYLRRAGGAGGGGHSRGRVPGSGC